MAFIAAEDSASRRALLTDSLVLDLSARITELRRAETALAALREASALLAVSQSDAAAALRTRVDQAVASGAPRGTEALAAEAKALLAAEAKAAAAAARRRAVLGALSTLGYEVRETIEQAWLRDGRVLLRKPGVQDYGVEIGAPADLERLQVRLVGSDRPGQPRTARRDAEQEVRWCGEFDQLRDLVVAAGGGVTVERAVEAGSQPVRTVTLPAVSEATAISSATRPRSGRLT